MSTATQTPTETDGAEIPRLARIAAGIDGFDEGKDAAALARMLAAATDADLLLTAILMPPLVIPAATMSHQALHEQAVKSVREARDELAPGARLAVETDIFVARGLERVVKREHRDLLVVGSRRSAEEGQVIIGRHTRQLLHDAQCAVAVAPRGLHRHPVGSFARIGVGYDGGPEADIALALGARIAASAGAELTVRGAIDDHPRPMGFSRLGTGAVIIPDLGWEAVGSSGASPDWETVVAAGEDSLRGLVQAATAELELTVHTEIRRARPAAALLELSEDVDLIVIGSRRWGPVARLLLGSTGEALLHGARCPVLVVPRPRA